jgi:aminopeptidase N
MYLTNKNYVHGAIVGLGISLLLFAGTIGASSGIEKDESLGAHEFAHQWWGNTVTCRDWNHFWLNEGIATFIAAAYLEHRFGRDVYLREIESYRTSYDHIRAAGKDKSLVFPDWLHPTREDRSLVYDKGACCVKKWERSHSGKD